jgi:hypothetical protein
MSASNGSGATMAPGRTIDLDAAAAARAEAQGEPVTLIFRESEFTLPVEMPADFALHAQAERLRESVSALIGEKAEEFFALRPSIEDITELVNAAARIYGVSPGEAAASAGS